MKSQLPQTLLATEKQTRLEQLKTKKHQAFRTRLAALEGMPDPGVSAEEHPKLVAKFNGYMTLLQKKLEKDGVTGVSDYYTSSYFSDLKEKRNISFNQDILEKMYKQYSLEEFASNVSKGIFDPTATPAEDQFYETLDRRAGEKIRR